MKSIYLKLLAVSLLSLTLSTSCKEDPEAINNIPEIFVDEASEILRSSAVLSGRLLATEQSHIKKSGFLVGSDSDFSGADTQTILIDTENGSFETQITGLEIGTPYFYAAFAENGSGERMVSTIKAFTTPTRSGALLTDLRMTDEATAAFEALLADDGGGEILSVGLCWGTMEKPTVFSGETTTATLGADNRFSTSLPLKKGTTYYVRAYAVSDITGDGAETISYSQPIRVTLENDPEPLPDAPETWKIYYTSADGNIIEPQTEETRTGDYGFGANIVSNTYENGQGVITFDGPVTSIGRSAFWNQKNERKLTSITLPESVTTIGDYAFFNSMLTEITIPKSVTEIGIGAFDSCEHLKSITIPDTVTSLGYVAFISCSSLEKVTLGSGITEIGSQTFAFCDSLKEVNLSNHIKIIGSSAFQECTSLEKISLPNSVTKIGATAFSGCTNLIEVYCLPTTPPTTTKNSNGNWLAFKENGPNRKIYVPNASVEAYKTAEGWKDYADSIFPMDGEPEPEKPILMVEQLDDQTTENTLLFQVYCSSQDAVESHFYFVEKATWDAALAEGASKRDVISEKGFHYYNSGAYEAYFEELNSTSGTLSGSYSLTPGTTYGLGIYVVNSAGVESEVLYLEAATLPKQETPETEDKRKIYVRTTDNWSEMYLYSWTLDDTTAHHGSWPGTQLTTVEEVNGEAYYVCALPEELEGRALGLVFNNGIGTQTQDVHITVSENLYFLITNSVAKAIDPFDPNAGGSTDPENCRILYTTTDGEVLTPYDSNVFGANIVSNTYENGQGVITFDGEVTAIGAYAFYNQSNLESITIPNSVTSIVIYAFTYCSGLKLVTLSENLIDIGLYSFGGCTSLSEITIPEKVTSIGEEAFYITNLAQIYCKPVAPPKGGERMFANIATNAKFYVPNASVEAYKAAEYWSDYADYIVGYDF